VVVDRDDLHVVLERHFIGPFSGVTPII
jgi:hypothetical protein